MKRSIIVYTFAALIVGLTSCQGKTNSEKTEESTATENQETA